MKIILSPSKTQLNNIDYQYKKVNCRFIKESTNLFKTIQNLSIQKMQNTFKIKGKLLDQTYQNYKTFKTSNLGFKAIDLYKGVVFEQIKVNDYNKRQIRYMDDHLRILSAMYGIVKPHTYIWPYRLDMTIKIDSINLYNYWNNDIDEYFKAEDYIINLASKEFSKLLKSNQTKLINIHFLEEQSDNSLKVVGYNAKKARGIMADLIIKDEVEDVNVIKRYNVDGYRFLKTKSDTNNFYFVKKR